jgi:uncharacterized protein YjiS (DUF1127 family)
MRALIFPAFGPAGIWRRVAALARGWRSRRLTRSATPDLRGFSDHLLTDMGVTRDWVRHDREQGRLFSPNGMQPPV